MASLNHAFKACGYITKKQQMAFFQLLESCCAFDFIAPAPYQSLHSHSSKDLLDYLEKDIFFNLQDSIHWLTTILNERLLLTDFHQKTAHIQKIYSEQLQALPPKMKQYKKVLSKSLKTLGMLQGNPWPSHEEIGHVVLLGEMEEVIKTRLQFIGDFQGDLYYLTNPRGLFNHEPSLAAILATWFELDVDSAEPIVQSVLNQHRLLLKSNKNWLHDLTGLKNDILLALQVHFGLSTLKWPHGMGHYYYEAIAARVEQRENTYDIAAKRDGRVSIADWPTAADMVNYHLIKERSLKKKFTRVNLIPVLAIGENKPANIYDCFKTWYQEYQQNIPKQARLIVVSGNEKNHAFLYNKAVIESILAGKNKFNTLVVGPASQKIYFQRALSEFGKSLFQRQHLILDHITSLSSQTSLCAWHRQLTLTHTLVDQRNTFVWNNSNTLLTKASSQPMQIDECINKESFDFFPSSIQSNILILNKIKEALLLDKKYMLLLMVVRLANNYAREGGFIKASALYDFAINIAYGLQKNQVWPRCYFIHPTEMSTKGISHKIRLHGIRSTIFSDMNQLSRHPNRQEITALYKTTQLQMGAFISSMINHAIKLTGIPLSDYAVINMGSYARGEATPFSDMEFFILLKQSDPNTVDYFKSMVICLLHQMIHLGETVLPALGEPFSRLYDPITRQGVSFDPNLSHASKTPLGRKDGEHRIYRLMGTPREMITLTRTAEPDAVLPQMLLSGVFLTGSKTIYTEYKKMIHTADYRGYGLFMVKKEIHDNSSHNICRKKRITHKIDALKPLQLLLEALNLVIGGDDNVSTYDKLDFLLTRQIIQWSCYKILEQAITFFLMIKIGEHFRFGRQRIDINHTAQTKQYHRATEHLYKFIDEKIKKHETNELISAQRMSDAYCSFYR